MANIDELIKLLSKPASSGDKKDGAQDALEEFMATFMATKTTVTLKEGVTRTNTHAHNEDVELPEAVPGAFGCDVPVDITNPGVDPEGGQENSLHHRYFKTEAGAQDSLNHYALLAQEFAKTATSIAAGAPGAAGALTPETALRMDKMRQLNQLMMMISAGIDGSIALPRITSLMMCMTQHPSCRTSMEQYFTETGVAIQGLRDLHKRIEALETERAQLLDKLEAARTHVDAQSVKAALYANEARVSRGRGCPPVEHRMLETVMTSLRTQVRQHLLRANHHLCVSESSERFPRMRLMLGIEDICNNDLRGISTILNASDGKVDGFMPANPAACSIQELFQLRPSTGGERIHRNIKTMHADDMGAAVGVDAMKAVFGQQLSTGFSDTDFSAVEQDLVARSTIETKKISQETELERMQRVREKLDAEKPSTKKPSSYVLLQEQLHVVHEGVVQRTISPYSKGSQRKSLAGKPLAAEARLSLGKTRVPGAALVDNEIDGQFEEEEAPVKQSYLGKRKAIGQISTRYQKRSKTSVIEGMQQVKLDVLPYTEQELVQTFPKPMTGSLTSLLGQRTPSGGLGAYTFNMFHNTPAIGNTQGSAPAPRLKIFIEETADV